MKALSEIMEMIALQEEVREELYALESCYHPGAMEETIKNLTECEGWERAREAVKTVTAPDENGLKTLFFMLRAAKLSYEKYRECGISEEIFADTMKCFTRFIGEYKKIYGRYGFDRDFWVGRELSLQLFRLGELEYEKVVEDGERAITIHIPSDAAITEENCQKSLEAAKRFFKEQDGTYGDAPYYCDSWLLSPALKKLLPDTSNIIKFQNLFTIQSTDESSEEYMYWIFKERGENTETLPEHTTLQRKAKQYLLAGGKIGSAKGYIKNAEKGDYGMDEKTGRKDK